MYRSAFEANAARYFVNESTVEATYNSLVVFDTRAGTKHYVVPIADGVGERKRLTIGGWYHEPD